MDDYTKSPSTPLPFTLDVQNSSGDPKRAEDLYRAFAADSTVIAVIGPSTSGEAIQISRLSDDLKLPVLALGASKRIVMDSLARVRQWVFKFAQNDDLAAQALLNALAGDGRRNIAFLYSEDGFGRSGAEQFKIAIAQVGVVKLGFSAGYDPKITNGDLIARSLPSAHDAVVIWGTAPGPAEIVRSLRKRQGENIYLSHGNASQQFITSLGPDAHGIVIVGSRALLGAGSLRADAPADQVILDYQAFWAKHFGGAPSHFGGHARDAFQALLEAYRKSVPRTRSELRDRLEHLEPLQGVTGTFRFSAADHAGLDVSAFATFRISNGQFVRWESIARQ